MITNINHDELTRLDKICSEFHLRKFESVNSPLGKFNIRKLHGFFCGVVTIANKKETIDMCINDLCGDKRNLMYEDSNLLHRFIDSISSDFRNSDRIQPIHYPNVSLKYMATPFKFLSQWCSSYLSFFLTTDFLSQNSRVRKSLSPIFFLSDRIKLQDNSDLKTMKWNYKRSLPKLLHDIYYLCRNDKCHCDEYFKSCD